MTDAFVHLHVHSDYSLLDGMGKIKEYVSMARDHGSPALALTDHGVLYGAIEHYQACRAAGIKPIVGVEMYVAPRAMRLKEGRQDLGGSHLLVLARDYQGYRNLIRLVSAAHLEGFYGKPRIDRALLGRHSDGLIVTSACLSGELARALIKGEQATAAEIADTYRTIVGHDNYFIEVQSHPGLREQDLANRRLVALAQKLGVPLVAAADTHYARREDAPAHDVLTCIQTGKLVSDPSRMRMGDDSFYLRSPREMRQAFREVPEACENTLQIAEMCSLEIPMGTWILPHFEVPPEYADEDAYLETLLRRALARLGPELSAGKDPRVYAERVRYEYDIIVQKGYSAYFLIVADFTTWARSRGIAATSRGSAAGSLVSYLLGITTADPLEYDLPFERFLNPYRPSPPDIDMDFEDSRREEVLRYVAEKYGADRVAPIIAFGKMESRAAVRDVARVLDVPYAEADALAKLIPGSIPPTPIRTALDGVPRLREKYEGDEKARRILDTAMRLEGVARHASKHAAGVIISREPLTEYAPLQRLGDDDKVVVQYSMNAAEGIGLLKMDLLGLANLSILGRALQIIRDARGIQLDLAHFPLDDARTFELLSTGETTGLFQLESAGMRRYIRELRPTNVRDIAAMIALYRPGPMEFIPEYIRRKHGEEPVSYLVPQLEPILRKSYGVLVYQDDILKLAIEIAGYTWEEADKLRKAVGKKIESELLAQEDKFIRGCQSHGGLTAEKARELWAWLLPFARFGFNASHAAAYSLIAYQTAYLKANYPAEYMSALLSVACGNPEKVTSGIAECRRMGIEVLPPDENRSGLDFTLEHDPDTGCAAIRFGLGAVRNVGAVPVQALIEMRGRLPDGRFSSLAQLIGSVDGRVANKRVLESLIKAGALDTFGARSQLLAFLDCVLVAGQTAREAREAGQMGLFDLGREEPAGADMPLSAVAPETSDERLSWEKEMLGLYISDHPLSRVLEERPEGIAYLGELAAEQNGERVHVVGIVEEVRVVATKAKKRMLGGRLTDLTGGMEIVAFPAAYERLRDVLHEDAIVEAWGRLEQRNDVLQIVLEAAAEYKGRLELSETAAEAGRPRNLQQLREAPPASTAEDTPRPLEAPELGVMKQLRIAVFASRDAEMDAERLRRLHAALVGHPGRSTVEIRFQISDGRWWLIEGHGLSVHAGHSLDAALHEVFGEQYEQSCRWLEHTEVCVPAQLHGGEYAGT